MCSGFNFKFLFTLSTHTGRKIRRFFGVVVAKEATTAYACHNIENLCFVDMKN